MQNEIYKMVGVYNMVDVYPTAAVYLVFKKGDEYFIGISGDDAYNVNYYYTEFLPFPEEKLVNVFFFDKCNLTFEVNSFNSKVGDIVNIAYQLTKKDIYVGTLDKAIEYLKNYRDEVESNNSIFDKAGLIEELDIEIEETEELVNKAYQDGAIEKNKIRTLNK